MNPSRTDSLSNFLRARVKTHSSVNRAQETAVSCSYTVSAIGFSYHANCM